MLASVAVLAVVILMVTQLMSNATVITIGSNKRIDADSQARMIFDRMANDFSKMIKRTDVDSIFYKNVATGSSAVNDSMFFYSEAASCCSSTNNQSSVSLVGYRVCQVQNPNNPASTTTVPVLQRLGKGLTWDASTSDDSTASTGDTVPGGAVFLTYSGSSTPVAASTIDGNWSSTVGTAANNYTDGVDADYHLLGDGVCRMEIAFLLSDGSISARPILSASPAGWSSGITFYNSSGSDPTSASDASANYAAGSRWFNTSSCHGYICTNATVGAAVWIRVGMQDVAAVIVAIAILDNTSRKMVTNISGLAGVLPDPTDADLSGSSPTLMAQKWAAVITSGSLAASSGIPVAAASQVRIYQRSFYIND